MAKTKYTSYISESHKINYKDPTVIEKRMIEAINAFKLFQLHYAGGDQKTAGAEISNAIVFAYEAMEGSYKYCLWKAVKDPCTKALFTEDEIDDIENDPCDPNGEYRLTHRRLMELFLKLYSTNFALKQRLNRILDGSKSNNQSKHSLQAPNPEAVQKSLKDISEFISEYVLTTGVFPLLSDSIIGGEETNWIEIKSNFIDNSEDYTNILIAAEVSDGDPVGLISFNWDMVIDFNPDSKTNGLFSCYQNNTGANPAIIRNLNAIEQNAKIDKTTTPIWLMANGSNDTEDSIRYTKSKEWISKRGRYFRNILEKFVRHYTLPVRFVILPGIESFAVQYIINEAVNFDKQIKGYLLLGEYSVFSDDEKIHTAQLPLSKLLAKMNTLQPTGYRPPASRMELPGAKEEISSDLYSRLCNWTEVIYSGIEKEDPEEKDVIEFYQGIRPISWNELERNLEIKAAGYEESKEKLDILLKSNSKSKYYCIYDPGLGGTTLLRRIAWDYHKVFPVLILKKYSSESHLSQLHQLAKMTDKPYLILADSNDIQPEMIETLHNDLETVMNHVIVYFQRKTRFDQPRGKSQLFSNLRTLSTQPDNAIEQSPFFYSLTAFDKDFSGIRPFIYHHRKSLTAQMRDALSFIALADLVHQSLDVGFFASLFPLMDNKEIKESLNNSMAFRSLVVFYRDEHTRETTCKIRFAAFTKEILIQATAKAELTGNTKINYLELSNILIDFIHKTRSDGCEINESLKKLLQLMIISRQIDIDANRATFADIIEQIGGKSSLGWNSAGLSAVHNVFEALIETYPEEPHFVAHYGRFLCYVEKNYSEAMQKIEAAIENNDDPYLLHMKGMVIAAEIQDSILPRLKTQSNQAGEIQSEEEDIELLHDKLKTAQDLFEQVRKKMRDESFAGYVSDINLCINVLETLKSIEKADTDEFLRNHANDWITKILDRAATLFEACNVSRGEIAEDEKDRLQEVEAKLSPYLHGLSAAIDRLSALVDEVDEDRRPMMNRLLARALLEKKNYKTDVLQTIADKMEENLRYEPDIGANIRIWFQAVCRLNVEDPGRLLTTATIRLNEWVTQSNHNLEAHFCRYIVTFIRAVEGSGEAEEHLKEYQEEMQRLAENSHIQNRTKVRFWLGKGSGLQRLLGNQDVQWNETEQTIERFESLKGSVGPESAGNYTAYIYSYKTRIYFSPQKTNSKISIPEDINQPVWYSVGFSYHGPRAFNSSVKRRSKESGADSNEKLESIEVGKKVTAKVKKNITKYVIVTLPGYIEENARIPVDCLLEPYSENNRPEIGAIIEAYVSDEAYMQNGKPVWNLSMEIPRNHASSYPKKKIQVELEKWKSKNKLGK